MSGPGQASRQHWAAALIRVVLEQSLLLPIGAVAGLIWANLAHESYEHFAHAVHFAVNDVGMVFFFALAAKEVVEATAPGGALSSTRRAAVPVLSALGGMAGPALIYTSLVLAAGIPELARGWAIPTATDIAFSYLTAQYVLGGRHPAIPFLLLLAIADDAFGLIILAVFYPSGAIRWGEMGVLLTLALGASFLLRRRKVTNFWPYVIVGGGLSWLALFRGGLHPALALVHIMPFLPHASRNPELFAASTGGRDTLNDMEHWWKTPVQLILCAFGLVNAGVPLTSVGSGTWIVFSAILLGKPLGIGAMAAVSSLMGLHLPQGLGWRDMVVVGLAAAIGFTVALFFATAAFPPGPLLDQAKTGALLSVLAAVFTVAAAVVLRVGRFSMK